MNKSCEMSQSELEKISIISLFKLLKKDASNKNLLYINFFYYKMKILQNTSNVDKH